ncbi:conjugal transfer protein TraI [Bacteroides fragilis]|uniref:Conjugal transfer protein TraI n=1 Tax=Bacteroides fragilis TaxID=817 RepID=A0A642HUD4_BACFG|nr:conjugal transfer protein TraI [Bacteroides fragilis]KAA4791778.1 conjugal transfer protein TraI [Bacteroides fragilis]KAA4802390.1 conjugal transfer protein TraI [Bacteroides fragilis]KAA4806171.1 conjugal transfer protein TraI [Bacteroides fragilis]KAA4812525.1 conjugal transfer protein TraI [Bacteroides fragilis]KAA4817431.1 conjugal transfer protein TraI [Bacteroides fragilis]
MNRLILLVESRIRGDVYVRFGGELPKTHRSNTAGRWMLSLPLKSVHDVVKGGVKVSKSIGLVMEISEIYVDNYQRMLSDENYTPDELAAISSGYAMLIDESSDVLQDLKNVVNVTGMSLSDAERLAIIDNAYRSLMNYRNLVRYYTGKTISVSYLRARKKNDMDRVMSLYGTANERYW